MKKQHIANLLVYSLGAFFICACSQDGEDLASECHEMQSDTNLISCKISHLQTTDAMKVALQFSKTNTNQSRSTTSVSSSDVTPVYSHDGTLVMYAVNYPNNQGYVLIGASKNYVPILAYSDKGNLNDSTLHSNPFINEYKEHIEEVANIDSDSLRNAYASTWLPYEDVSSKTRIGGEWSDAEVAALRAQAVQSYEAQGYTCLSLQSALSIIPPTANEPNRAQNFVDQICAQTASGYDPMIVDIFATKTAETTYAPLLQTEWHQHYPFAGWAENGLAGCVITAAVQLMYYHKHPNSYDWNAIPTNITTLNTELDRLIQNLQTQAEADDSRDSVTIVTRQNMKRILQNNGYQVQEYSYPSSEYRQKVENSIINGYPVLMTGKQDNASVGHAWICDGYRYSQNLYSAGLFTRLGVYRLQNGIYDERINYFHMKWGLYNGYCDGWYYQDQANIANINLSSNRYVFIITPN